MEQKSYLKILKLKEKTMLLYYIRKNFFAQNRKKSAQSFAWNYTLIVQDLYVQFSLIFFCINVLSIIFTIYFIVHFVGFIANTLLILYNTILSLLFIKFDYIVQRSSILSLFIVVANMNLLPPSFSFRRFLSSSAVRGKFLIATFACFTSAKACFTSFLFNTFTIMTTQM